MPPLPFSRKRDAGSGKSDDLDRVPLLALLEPDLRQRVRKHLSRRRVRAGQPLYHHGNPADTLYCVVSGRFRVFMGAARPNQERVLRFLGPGDVLGEAAFMAETPHVTDAVAIEDADVWTLARADFDALLGDHQGVLRYLGGLIAERQTEANAKLASDSAPEDHFAARGYITAVYSPRGGAGVTTTAVNLAIALAERHPDDTVLLDLDVLFGHAMANLWLEPRGVLAQITPIALRALDRTGLDFYLQRHSSSLRILAAATRPEEGQTITGEHVRAALGTLRRHFGHIVLDLPHSFNEVTLAGLELADRVLVLGTAEAAILDDVLECRRIFQDVIHLPADRITYVLNHPQPYAGVPVASFSAATNTPWVEIAHGGDAPSAAALRGESLLGTRPNNAVARAVAHLAEAIGSDASQVAALAGRAG